MVKIFISYRRADSRKDAGRIYDRLIDPFGKENVFKDVDTIAPGDNFPTILRDAVNNCDVLLAIIGRQWVTIADTDGNRRLNNPNDFVRIEVESGLQRDDCIVIPVLVDGIAMPSASDLPESLHGLLTKHASTIHDDPDFHRDVDRLIASIQLRFHPKSLPTTGKVDNLDERSKNIELISRLSKSTEHIISIIGEPFEWCEVPAGDFYYGDDRLSKHLYDFKIAKYPITYSQFQVFIEEEDGYFDWRRWKGLADSKHYRSELGDQKWEISNLPRENVSWYDAIAFCRWLSNRLGGGYALDQIDDWLIRLPTGFEWEKAARGTDGREYPYGNRYDELKSNTRESNIGQTTPVTRYPMGQSPYGAFDMSGNVWEWCLTDYHNPTDMANKEGLSNNNPRVLRGGAWNYDSIHSRPAFRNIEQPSKRHDHLGFRIVHIPKP